MPIYAKWQIQMGKSFAAAIQSQNVYRPGFASCCYSHVKNFKTNYFDTLLSHWTSLFLPQSACYDSSWESTEAAGGHLWYLSTTLATWFPLIWTDTSPVQVGMPYSTILPTGTSRIK